MKEYLLLRNNAQSGPYTLDELRAIGLRAYDLVWIENKSFSWKYPSEISQLAGFAPPLEEVSNEPFGEKVHMVVDVDDLARVLPSVKKESKEHNIKSTPVLNINHVVALKPKIDHVEIRTIKSTSQPNILKVQVREMEGIVTPPEEIVKEVIEEEKVAEIDSSLATLSKQDEPISNGYFNQQVPYTQRITGNKLELAVLAIGAASLLAVIYLLLTTGYQY